MTSMTRLIKVPYALLMIALGELNGIPSEYIHGFLGSLFALRVAHVEFGLYGKGTLGYGRPIGFFFFGDLTDWNRYYGTLAIVGAVAGWLGKLAWDSVTFTF